MKKHDAFERVYCDYPLVKEQVDEMREVSDSWRIDWPTHSRTTSMVGLAWYAKEFDDEAEVTPVGV